VALACQINKDSSDHTPFDTGLQIS